MNPKKTIVTVFLLTVLVSMHAQNWDLKVLKTINPHNPDAGFWKTATNTTYLVSAAVPVSLLAAGFIEKDNELKRKSLVIFGGIAIEAIISETLKTTINRTRPAITYPADVFPYRVMTARSFPSGHASLSFAVATGLTLQFRKWWVAVPAYLWAGSVCYSRMYLGVHYPSDVLAGAVIGTGSAYLAWWLRKKFFR